MSPDEYLCLRCGFSTPKGLWGPGRTLCPACGERAPTAEEFHKLENRRRSDAAEARLCAADKCSVCGKPTDAEPASVHAPCVARLAAYLRAQETWGRAGLVGYGALFENGAGAAFYVGAAARGAFTFLGMGNDWEEAFRNARRVLFYLPHEKVVYADE